MSTAIVTGGAGGLGRAICLRLAADGRPIAVVDIDAAEAEITCDQVMAAGGRAVAFAIDLRDEQLIAAMVDQAGHELGPVEVLVNNAAIFPAGPMVDVTAQIYDDQAETRPGAIVNLASITQHGGWEHMVPYATTKGAAATMTRAMATELGPFEIRVNCVAPGAFPTPAEAMHQDPVGYAQRIIDSQALKRRGDFADVAAAVSFLVGPDSSFITGQTLNVDGGWKMA